MSKPAPRKAAAFSSSRALHQTKSSMSGWSTSSTTILAARRVLPPDLIVPAHASAPRMNDTGPLARPPLRRCSIDPRIFDRLMPEPDPPRKMFPSLVFQARIDSMLSSTERMKQAEHCGCSSKPTLNQTGELNAAIWCRSTYVSSASNVSPSSRVAQLPLDGLERIHPGLREQPPHRQRLVGGAFGRKCGLRGGCHESLLLLR